MEDISKYKQFYTGTDNSPALKSVAKTIRSQVDGENITLIFLKVRQFINDTCYVKSSGKPVAKRFAQSLIESRRAKASELVTDCIASCGSMATLAASLLRNMGFAVKLIHGSHPRSENHAWIEIYDEVSNTWQAYDMTGYGDRTTGVISPDHKRIKECADWYEIKDYLLAEHKKWVASRR